MKPQRCRKDFRFLAANPEEALQWVNGFADQQCYVNCLPHPLVSSKKQASDFVPSDFSFEAHIRCKSPPKVLVILNPRSGRGRSSKVFHGMVEPIFKVNWSAGLCQIDTIIIRPQSNYICRLCPTLLRYILNHNLIRLLFVGMYLENSFLYFKGGNILSFQFCI